MTVILVSLVCALSPGASHHGPLWLHCRRVGASVTVPDPSVHPDPAPR